MDRLTERSGINRLRKSFYNVFAYFLNQEEKNTQVMNCLLKWGEHLGIHKLDLQRIIAMPGLLSFQKPLKTNDSLEQIYDVLFMINMDGVVEDEELSVISHYTSVLGLEPYVVNNLLKALVSAPYEGVAENELRKDINSHPEMYV